MDFKEEQCRRLVKQFVEHFHKIGGNLKEACKVAAAIVRSYEQSLWGSHLAAFDDEIEAERLKRCARAWQLAAREGERFWRRAAALIFAMTDVESKHFASVKEYVGRRKRAHVREEEIAREVEAGAWKTDPEDAPGHPHPTGEDVLVQWLTVKQGFTCRRNVETNSGAIIDVLAERDGKRYSIEYKPRLNHDSLDKSIGQSVRAICSEFAPCIPVIAYSEALPSERLFLGMLAAGEGFGTRWLFIEVDTDSKVCMWREPHECRTGPDDESAAA